MRVLAFVLLITMLSCQTKSDPCPVGSSLWIEADSLPDSLKVPPQFFFDHPTVPVEHLVVCEHGIFLNFRAEQEDTLAEYWISFPMPTYEEYEKYFQQAQMESAIPILDSLSVRKEVEAMVAAATKSCNELKLKLHGVLDGDYAEGESIALAGFPAKLKLEFPLVFVWGEQEMPFETFPGIYQRRVGSTVQ